MHTVDFNPKLIALAYIMIFNLYPVKNLQHCPNQELFPSWFIERKGHWHWCTHVPYACQMCQEEEGPNDSTICKLDHEYSYWTESSFQLARFPWRGKILFHHKLWSVDIIFWVLINNQKGRSHKVRPLQLKVVTPMKRLISLQLVQMTFVLPYHSHSHNHRHRLSSSLMLQIALIRFLLYWTTCKGPLMSMLTTPKVNLSTSKSRLPISSIALETWI